MLTSLRCTDRAWLLSILAIAAGACTRDSDRVHTASAASSTPPDTAPPAATAESGAPETTAAPAAATKPDDQDSGGAARTAPKKRPLPKPSIDPGRITPKPPRDSTGPTAKPAPDSPSAGGGATSPAAALGPGLKYDATSNTVTFELQAGPFNWNGYSSGGATLTLPPKANVVMNFVNKDGTPHSAEVISGEGPIPNAAVDPAIPRAYTNKLLEGLPQEATDVMRFTVPESGGYRIFCGVPGHGLSGMWIWMKIDPAAKAPTFGPTKA
jgi:hypothetical protein